MKTQAKIIAYCCWVSFLIWFSTFSDKFFFDFIGAFKNKIFGSDIPPEIDFAITFIPWNCFISLLVWLPLLFLKQRRLQAAQEIAIGLIFSIVLIGINLFAILIWCVYFPEIIGNFNGVTSFSALEQYAIADGWTSLKFKGVWVTYILISTAVSATAPIFIRQIKRRGVLKTLST